MALLNATHSYPNLDIPADDAVKNRTLPWLNLGQNIAFSMLFVLIVGGNLLVVYCLVTIKRMHTITGIFLLNLAATDLGVGFLSLPITLISINRPGMVKKQWFCDINGISMVVFLLASLLTMTSLSMQKYMTVGYQMRSRFTTNVAKRIIIAIWAVSSLFALGPVVGWSYYATSKHGRQCGPFAWTLSGRIYSACIFLMGVIIPITVMGYCYCRLYWKMRKHLNRMRVSTVVSRDDVASRRDTLRESRMIHTLIIMGVVFITCWSPSATLVGLEFGKVEEPLAFEVFALIFAYGNSMMNPFIYALRHEDFRRGFIHTIRQIFGACSVERHRNMEIREGKELPLTRRGRPKESIESGPNENVQ